MKSQRQAPRAARQGSALFTSLLTVVILAGMSVAVLSVALASQREHQSALARARALAAAEAAVGDAFLQIAATKTAALTAKSKPRGFSDDRYWGNVVTNADGTFTITAVGESGNARRALEVIVNPAQGGVFQNAIFAGNSSKDPAYTMGLGGTKAQADAIIGNIYSGGNLTFKGNATVKGKPSAAGKVTTVVGSILALLGKPAEKAESGVKQSLPDIAGMNYATNNDVDVAKEFKTAKFASAAAGGKAYQLPATNPAHIFRMHPDDRKANWSTTTKNDYFLEDPYEAMKKDSKSDGSDAFKVSLTEKDAKAGTVSGNKKVYYIDGNLWIHNLSTMSLKLSTAEATGIQVTIVVNGNIYISDNVFLDSKTKDGIAFIATKDSAVKDSGNIYFGDPTFGTLEAMQAFMYAENNFLDNNLSATGSAVVNLLGNMTAGNQVAINRDYGTQHSKLGVTFDDRLASGALVLPGLPKASGVTSAPLISVWREVGVP